MTILQLIQAQCKASGISDKYAERIQKLFKIEKEEGIGNYVAMFKAEVLPAIEAAGKGNGEKAKKRAIEEYEKLHGLKDGKPVEPAKKDEKPDLSGVSPEVKAIIEAQTTQISELTNLVKGVVQGQSESQKLALIREKLKGKIDEEFINDYIGQVKLDAEDIDAEVERVAKVFTDMQQKFITKAVAEGNYQPVGGGVVNNDKDIDAYVEKKNSDKSGGAFEGIEL